MKTWCYFKWSYFKWSYFKWSYVLIALIAGLAFTVGVNVHQTHNEPTFAKQTYVYQPVRTLEKFSLQDQNGKVFSNANLKGKWSFIFLGYISCPDICPLTMANFSRVLPELEQSVTLPTQVVFVSVDPKRDTTEKMAEYTHYFHKNIVGLHAEHKDLFPFVRNLGLMYSVPTEEQIDNYYVDHSASVILTNPDGNITAIFKPKIVSGQVPSVDMETLAKDFATLANRS